MRVERRRLIMPAAALLMALGLGGCVQVWQADGALPAACLLPSQRPMVVAQLFFGRDVPGRAPVSDAEWSDFAARTIAGQFPDGFTIYDGEGAWLDPQTKSMSREATKTLLVAAEPTPDLGARLAAVMDSYRSRFAQESVGLVTHTACAAF
jgi:hypothetical protein